MHKDRWKPIAIGHSSDSGDLIKPGVLFSYYDNTFLLFVGTSQLVNS